MRASAEELLPPAVLSCAKTCPAESSRRIPPTLRVVLIPTHLEISFFIANPPDLRSATN
jgi:hypothetical protein